MTAALYNRYIPALQQTAEKKDQVITTAKQTLNARKRKRAAPPETGIEREREAELPGEGDGHTGQCLDGNGDNAEAPERRSKKKKARKQKADADESLHSGITKNPLTEQLPSDLSPSAELATEKGNEMKSKRSHAGKAQVASENHQADVLAADSDGGTAEGGLYENVSDEQGHLAGSKHKSIRSKFQKSSTLAKAQLKEGTGEPPVQAEEGESSRELHDLIPIPQPELALGTASKPTFSALPPWLAHPTRVSSQAAMPFEALPISPKVRTALKSKGYQSTSAVQSAVLPLLLPGSERWPGDICISAATGSGKTLAYILPITESLRHRTVVKLRALVVVPTRELIPQVLDVCELCATGSSLKIGTALGSKPLKEEQELLVRRDQKYETSNYGMVHGRSNAENPESLEIDDDPCTLDDGLRLLPGHVVDYTSKVDILICTPGRLVDHIRSTKGFNLDHIQWLVIDEADRLTNGTMQDWLELVNRATEEVGPAVQKSLRHRLLIEMGNAPERRHVRKVVLSATLTKDVGKLSAFKLRRPKLVVLESTRSSTRNPVADDADLNGSIDGGQLKDDTDGYDLPPTLHEKAVAVGDGIDKPLFLLEILKTHLGICSAPIPKTSSESSDQGPFNDRFLIFTNNNENALRLARLLCILHPPYSSAIRTLTKSGSTSSGRKVLSAFRKGKVAIVIASDRASRGLDVEELGNVINYDIPASVTSYVHRVGRTARAGKEGHAWTLVAHNEARWFWKEIASGREIQRGQGRKVERVKVDIEALGEEAREAYANGLKLLGEEAEGHVNQRAR